MLGMCPLNPIFINAPEGFLTRVISNRSRHLDRRSINDRGNPPVVAPTGVWGFFRGPAPRKNQCFWDYWTGALVTGSRLLNAIGRLGIVLCCLLLLAGCQSTPGSNGLTVQVQRVISGQTIDVLNPTQQPALLERVRLIGIEAPDLKQQPWGEAAKNYLERIVTKNMGQQLVLQPVLLEPDVQEKDTSGRWLAYVWYEGVLLNEQLVKQGYVLAAPRSPNHKYDDRIARAQEYARIMGYGIWNPDQPMRLTPAEFRRQNP